MSVFQNNLLMGAASQGAVSVYEIEQSIRFDDSGPAFMRRTPGSATNKRTWTYSGWIKRGDQPTNYAPGMLLLQHGNSGTGLQETIRINTASGSTHSTLMYYSDSPSSNLTTTQVFRDASAWYHIVLAKDTTQAVASDRVKIYINGQRVTSFSTETYPSLNGEGFINSNVLHNISADQNGGSNYDGYMAEMHFIDGSQLDPSSFGSTNSKGIWIPIEYEGSYGTNGWHIDGRDASDLGDDESGNGNDWATTGLATHDQMADTPTNNHAIMNVIDHRNPTNWTISNGNLDVKWQGNNGPNSLFSTLSMPATGKWYFEFEFDADGSGNVLTNQNMRIGLMREDTNAAFVQANSTVDLTLSSTTPEILVVLGNGGNAPQVKGMGSTINNIAGSVSVGDRINFARNGANLWVGKNGTYYNSGNPATGSNPTLSNLQLQGYRANMHWTTGSTSANCIVKAYFGGDKSIGSGTGFNDTVPEGFLALNTTNLGS
tara:strand:+ start:1505 stop:2965 length:1461 start_codon:yes stop_codon:yes gene_type:complete